MARVSAITRSSSTTRTLGFFFLWPVTCPLAPLRVDFTGQSFYRLQGTSFSIARLPRVCIEKLDFFEILADAYGAGFKLAAA
jgi:hypothetical protein